VECRGCRVCSVMRMGPVESGLSSSVECGACMVLCGVCRVQTREV
jgi:hypothetical protein